LTLLFVVYIGFVLSFTMSSVISCTGFHCVWWQSVHCTCQEDMQGSFLVFSTRYIRYCVSSHCCHDVCSSVCLSVCLWNEL